MRHLGSRMLAFALPGETPAAAAAAGDANWYAWPTGGSRWWSRSLREPSPPTMLPPPTPTPPPTGGTCNRRLFRYCSGIVAFFGPTAATKRPSRSHFAPASASRLRVKEESLVCLFSKMGMINLIQRRAKINKCLILSEPLLLSNLD